MRIANCDYRWVDQDHVNFHGKEMAAKINEWTEAYDDDTPRPTTGTKIRLLVYGPSLVRDIDDSEDYILDILENSEFRKLAHKHNCSFYPDVFCIEVDADDYIILADIFGEYECLLKELNTKYIELPDNPLCNVGFGDICEIE